MEVARLQNGEFPLLENYYNRPVSSSEPSQYEYSDSEDTATVSSECSTTRDENDSFTWDENDYFSCDENNSISRNGNDYFSWNGNDYIFWDENDYYTADENDYFSREENNYNSLDENEAWAMEQESPELDCQDTNEIYELADTISCGSEDSCDSDSISVDENKVAETENGSLKLNKVTNESENNKLADTVSWCSEHFSSNAVPVTDVEVLKNEYPKFDEDTNELSDTASCCSKNSISDTEIEVNGLKDEQPKFDEDLNEDRNYELEETISCCSENFISDAEIEAEACEHEHPKFNEDTNTISCPSVNSIHDDEIAMEELEHEHFKLYKVCTNENYEPTDTVSLSFENFNAEKETEVGHSKLDETTNENDTVSVVSLCSKNFIASTGNGIKVEESEYEEANENEDYNLSHMISSLNANSDIMMEQNEKLEHILSTSDTYNENQNSYLANRTFFCKTQYSSYDDDYKLPSLNYEDTNVNQNFNQINTAEDEKPIERQPFPDIIKNIYEIKENFNQIYSSPSDDLLSYTSEGEKPVERQPFPDSILDRLKNIYEKKGGDNAQYLIKPTSIETDFSMLSVEGPMPKKRTKKSVKKIIKKTIEDKLVKRRLNRSLGTLLKKLLEFLLERKEQLDGENASLSFDDALESIGKKHMSTKKRELLEQKLRKHPNIKTVEKNKYEYNHVIKVMEFKAPVVKHFEQLSEIASCIGLTEDEVLSSVVDGKAVLNKLVKSGVLYRAKVCGRGKSIFVLKSELTEKLDIDKEFKKIWNTTSLEGVENCTFDGMLIDIFGNDPRANPHQFMKKKPEKKLEQVIQYNVHVINNLKFYNIY